ncbi:MAG: hypothetical protein ACLRTD_26710 [Bacteroides sp.]
MEVDVDPDKLSGKVLSLFVIKGYSLGTRLSFQFQCPTYTSGGFPHIIIPAVWQRAATQIMRYYNYPFRSGSKSYVSNGKT